MNISARLEQHQQTNADEELAIDAAFEALSSEPAPYTVRQHVEEMEDAGASFGFQRGVFYQADNHGDPAALQALRVKAHKAGISNQDLKAFLIAASRPGPSPVKVRKGLFDHDVFKDRLRHLEPAELGCLFDALVAGANAMHGVYSQPRVQCSDRAESAVSDVMDELSAAYGAVVTEAENREPDQANAGHLFRIAAGYHLQCHEEPIQVAVTAVRYAEAAAL